jgi:hypothetical protein
VDLKQLEREQLKRERLKWERLKLERLDREKREPADKYRQLGRLVRPCLESRTSTRFLTRKATEEYIE